MATRLEYVRHFKDLEVYQRQRTLAKEVFALSKRFPREGKTIGVQCVFSREAVAPPDASCDIEGDGSLNCHGYGSVVSVTLSAVGTTSLPRRKRCCGRPRSPCSL